MAERTCACGCGGAPASGNFLPGHDQKLRDALEQRAGGLTALRDLVERAKPMAPPPADDALAAHRAEWDDDAAEIAEQDRVRALGLEERTAVYVQKYENFRHFDSLRWQMPGLVFAVGGAIFGFAPRMGSGLPHYLASGMYGLFALAGVFLMHRIRLGLRRNNTSLRRFAISLGDYSVRPPREWIGASIVIHLLLALVGLGSLALSVYGWLNQ